MRDLESIVAAAGTTATHEQWPPVGAPLLDLHRDEPWRPSSHFDNSVNAVSFGFVATAILVSMFLVMAIFERLIRPTTTASDSTHQTRLQSDLDSRVGFSGSKLGYQSPKMAVYSKGVSVLMPGDEIPTFIAHPVPVPCSPERVQRPHHHHHSLSRDSTRSSNANTIQEC